MFNCLSSAETLSFQSDTEIRNILKISIYTSFFNYYSLIIKLCDVIKNLFSF